jgi:aminopeptidase N
MKSCIKRIHRKEGRTTTKFVDSMRMSTYLVAFVVGPLEVTKIGKSDNN